VSIYELFQTDIDKEKNGAVAKFRDSSFRVARIGRFNSKVDQYFKENGIVYFAGPNRNDESTADFIASCVVLGWEGVKDVKGQELEFSFENCKKLLLDLPYLMDEIALFSQKIENYRLEKEEKQKKN